MLNLLQYHKFLKLLFGDKILMMCTRFCFILKETFTIATHDFNRVCVLCRSFS